MTVAQERVSISCSELPHWTATPANSTAPLIQYTEEKNKYCTQTTALALTQHGALANAETFKKVDACK